VAERLRRSTVNRLYCTSRVQIPTMSHYLKMRILKSHPILSIVNGMLVDLPAPSNLSYLWGFGSLLGLCLVVQLGTGIFLAMHYTPNIEFAFSSVEHIMRDVNYG